MTRLRRTLEAIRRRLRDEPWLRGLRSKRLGREARSRGHVDWGKVAGIGTLASPPSNGRAPRVLIATSTGVHFGASRLDTVLAAALALRGAEVEHLYCDSALPVCMVADKSWFPDPASLIDGEMQNAICRHCFEPARQALAPLRQPVHRVGALLTGDDRDEIARMVAKVPDAELGDTIWNGVAVGQHARAGTLRYFARGTLEPGSEPVLRAYLQAAAMMQRAVERLLAANHFDVVVTHHGIYVPQGVVAEVVRRAGVRLVTWNTGYRERCFVFSHGDTYHRTMISEPGAIWRDIELSAERERIVRDYLQSRRSGRNDWISFNRNPDESFASFAATHGLVPGRPVISALTNVFWDAQLHYPSNAFPSMREWLVETVRYFAGRPDLYLLIRAHPAEATGALPARETAATILAEAFDDLPSNVVLIPAQSPLSTYAVIENSRACLIFATKTGIEILTMGVPVAAAGEAWIRGKGLCLEASSPEEYFALLDTLPDWPPPSRENEVTALKYAYHFFFRRMIPIGFARPLPGWPPFHLDVPSIDVLKSGSDPGLDAICRGILEGAPFHFDPPDLTH